MNDRVYIHEFIDIRGHNRANYMHHMTANWSPNAQEDRKQLCYGVWALLGSTGAWPQTVNMWEHEGWAGLAENFAIEGVGSGAQDPKLEKWWAKASEFRKGGFDRIVVPAPWTRTITELCADGVRGEVYAHEQIDVQPGSAWEYVEMVRQEAIDLHARFGWELAGAWVTAMRNDSEVFLLWAIPTWEQWGELEAAQRSDAGLIAWRDRASEVAVDWQRTLLVDAPLSPFRTGRQPQESDRDTFQLPPE